MGDFGLILNYVVVRNISYEWIHVCMDEILQRHGTAHPNYLFVDVGCCHGKLIPLKKGEKKKVSHHAWENVFIKKLDGCHMIMRIIRECNAEHLRVRN